MGDLIAIDPSQVRTVAADFSDAGRHLLSALERLQDGLAGLGACYGRDKQGREFGDPYEQARRAIEDALRKMADGVCSADGGLRAMAATHAGIDDHAGATLRGIGGPA